MHVLDLSIEGTFYQLDLADVRWSEVLRGGYFGIGWGLGELITHDCRSSISSQFNIVLEKNVCLRID